MQTFSPQPSSIHPLDAEIARQALGRVFWGALICVFDFHFSSTTNGSGFRFDVINDVIGTVLIVWGIGQLAPLVNSPKYTRIMRFCYVIAVIAVFDALSGHIIIPWPPPLRMVFIVFNFVSLVAIYCFCGAMRQFCLAGLLLEPAESWKFSRLLFLIFNLIPGGLLASLSLLAATSGNNAHLNIGPIAMVLAITAFVSLIHFLISIWRTRRDLGYIRDQPSIGPRWSQAS